MSWTQDLLVAVAEHLDATTSATFRTTGSYVAGDTAIVFKGMPTAPDRAIALTPYDVDAPLADHVIQGLQVRCRGTRDPRDVDGICDEVRDALHGLTQTRIGITKPVPVAVVRRASHASLGPDGNGRWETTSNYYLTAARPAPALRD